LTSIDSTSGYRPRRDISWQVRAKKFMTSGDLRVDRALYIARTLALFRCTQDTFGKVPDFWRGSNFSFQHGTISTKFFS
jgi:hypothetical protein